MLQVRTFGKAEGGIFPMPDLREGDETRRAAPRRRVFQRADVLAVDALADMELVDLTDTNLTGESDEALLVGEHLHVSFGGLCIVPAIVRWVHGSSFGLQLQSAPPVLRKGAADMAGNIRLITGIASQRAVVRNISDGGMMIEGLHGATQDQRLLVRLADGWAVTGRIVWIENGRAGIELDPAPSFEDAA